MTVEQMRREQVVREYKIENGVIRSPGKFEGEMLYVPYFWEVYLNGCADSDDGNVITFEVTDDDRKSFPELKRRRTVKLTERSDGFVCEV